MWYKTRLESDKPTLKSVLDRYPSVFQDGLGILKGFTAKIYVDPTAEPKFHPARPSLQEAGTLEPVEISEWAALIVAVLKGDRRSVRICGDFSVTVNPVSRPSNVSMITCSDDPSNL